MAKATKAVSKAISRAKSAACGRTSVIVLAVLLLGALGLAMMAVFMPQVPEHFSAGPSVQLVHAKWCGHCKTLLKPGGEWEKLKANMPGVRFAVLDESTLKGKAAVKKYDVAGFPDIRVVTASGDTLATYSGQRTEPAMRDWVLKTIPSTQKK